MTEPTIRIIVGGSQGAQAPNAPPPALPVASSLFGSGFVQRIWIDGPLPVPVVIVGGLPNFSGMPKEKPDLISKATTPPTIFPLNPASAKGIGTQPAAPPTVWPDLVSIVDYKDLDVRKKKEDGIGFKDIANLISTAGVPFLGGASKIASGVTSANPLAIVSGAMEVLKDFRDVLVGAVRDVTKFGLSLVQPTNDPSQFVGAIGDASKMIGDKLLYLAPPLGIFASVVGEAVSAVGQFMKAMDGFVDRYAKFSPVLMQAKVQADVNQLMQDMRRAQELTPMLLGYINKRAEMQQKFEDLKIRFIEKMMPIAIKGMELAEQLLPFVEMAVNVLLAIAKALGGLLPPVMDIRDDVRGAKPITVGADLFKAAMEGFLTPDQKAEQGGFNTPRERGFD